MCLPFFSTEGSKSSKGSTLREEKHSIDSTIASLARGPFHLEGWPQ